MRVYGQCMVILPEALDELAGSENGRWFFPIWDQFGGQFIETGPLNSFDLHHGWIS